ncbi:hypothetical protein [Acanthopleuribacter pedis]|uniref:DUF2834 domain-containing protein n=1 Tax=Acanthopleuribacter pedis TaxID=442870 RepID=A0A8J7QLH5_9BACT|nr:hypothetical protein [Acanthopleuribacter pedis]MBO1323336.1 hypothetical protein [Acanthopleuribacter pedis]
MPTEPIQTIEQQGFTQAKPAALGATILLIAVTLPALWFHGYWGIIAPHFQSWGAGQVLTDLVIALAMVLVWMWFDAKKQGRRFWPWLLLTLAAGSFGPLLYVLFRPAPAKPAQ